LLPAELRVAVPISVDLPALGFSLAITLLTGILFGLAPATQALKRGPHENLKDGERVVTGANKRTRSALIVAETALAVILLAGAGLLIRSFAAVRGLDAGFQPENVMTMQISLSGQKYREVPRQVAFFREAVQRMQTVPGVQYAGAISWRPLGVGSSTSFLVDELPQPPAGQEPVAEVRAVEGDFFRAMGIPLLRGRSFDPAQDRAEHPVKKVVVNETMVHNFWPGQDPIGKRISMDWDEMLHAEVIGVAKDVRIRDLEEEPRNTIYWYQPQFPYSFMTLVARTTGDPQQVVGGIRAQIAALDPELPVAAVASMEEVVDTTLQQRRFGVVLLGTMAGLALLLASVGLYGVISYSVAQRTPEFGVRLALGAPPRQILRLVLANAARMAGIGVAAGIVGALALARFMSSFVFGVSTRDPLTLVVVAMVLAAVAMFASLAPAWRAMKVDPMVALRYE
jgi:putative ABC transport system permease protein